MGTGQGRLGLSAVDRAGADLERRHSSRRPVAAEEPLARIRLRTGRELTVVDIGSTGSLVEGAVRLLPGTHVDAHVTTAIGRVLVRSRIVRAWVSEIGDEGLTYRSALAFQQPIETAQAGYQLPARSVLHQEGQGSAYPEGAGDHGEPRLERLSA